MLISDYMYWNESYRYLRLNCKVPTVIYASLCDTKIVKIRIKSKYKCWLFITVVYYVKKILIYSI